MSTGPALHLDSAARVANDSLSPSLPLQHGQIGYSGTCNLLTYQYSNLVDCAGSLPR